MPGHILIVDDEPDVLDAWALAFKLEGYRVARAPDAKTALDLVRADSFDLVVLDYIMPSMTGIDLLNRIREQQPRISSIIVSGKIDSTVEEAVISADLQASVAADIYLHKPVDNERLLSAAAELLKGDGGDWKAIAERHLNAKKPQAKIKAAEKSLNKLKKAPRKK